MEPKVVNIGLRVTQFPRNKPWSQVAYTTLTDLRITVDITPHISVTASFIYAARVEQSSGLRGRHHDLNADR